MAHRIRCFLLICIALTCLASLSEASIVVGDKIKLQRGPGGIGGEFGVYLANDASETTLFATFCLEKRARISFENPLHVDSILNEAVGGGYNWGPKGDLGGDLLDRKTQWLYYNFRLAEQGALTQSPTDYVFGDIFDFGAGREESAIALQDAIWHLENEMHGYGAGEDYYQLAVEEEKLYQKYLDEGGTYTGNMDLAIGRVRALNLSFLNEDGTVGGEAQSQLYLLPVTTRGGNVPEPASLVIWSIFGCCGAAGAYRRQRSKRGHSTFSKK